jgi:hypothetical protein
VTPGGRLESVLLLESSPAGDLRKVELATRTGLLSIHPEPDDGLLHGNRVSPDGVEHIRLPWMPGAVLLVQGSPLAAAVAAQQLASRIGAGEGHSVAVIEVGPDLGVALATWRVARVSPSRWWLLPAAGGTAMSLDLDERGVPAIGGALEWPLELDETE